MKVTDLIEEWIETRSKFQRQLKMLEIGEVHRDDKTLNAATASHLKNCISELNKLLKEHAAVGRS